MKNQSKDENKFNMTNLLLLVLIVLLIVFRKKNF